MTRAAEILAAGMALRDAAAARVRGWCPHRPHPRQAQFLALNTREALYGGAAGGGKSDALLMGALQYVDVPGYAALILRRTFRDLAQPDAIMARSHTWLRGTSATWSDRDKRWTFPSGATLTFGYCDTARDVYQYQGAALQYVGWDELTQFPEQPYRYLFSRLRRLAGVDVPLRVRAATNPGGIGHEWVRRRFISAPSHERPFVPASLDDNPSLDAASYRASLAELDATTRQQLEHGVWVRDAGGLVYAYDDARNGADMAPALDNYILGLDFGVRDENGIVVLGWREHDPTVYVVHGYRHRGGPSDVANEVQRLESQYRFVRIVGDVGGMGKAFAEELRTRFSIPVDPAEKNNKRGYISLFNADLERGRIRAMRASCKQLIDEWCELPWREDRSAEADGFDNHASDAALYAWRAASAYHETPIARAPTYQETVAQREADLWEQREAEIAKQVSAEWWE